MSWIVLPSRTNAVIQRSSDINVRTVPYHDSYTENKFTLKRFKWDALESLDLRNSKFVGSINYTKFTENFESSLDKWTLFYLIVGFYKEIRI